MAVQVYRNFNELKDFQFRNQICSAAVSVSNNIALDRKSKPNFANFLRLSIGSCSEVRSMLYLAVRLGYLTEEAQKPLLELSNEESRILHGLRESVLVKNNKEINKEQV